ncbi:hypothetical protein FUAX_42750 (plasmid) [Fulvitalea axinellae]|uniref:Uncharacterized protein n=1 Tax=Fulvitalea axinellae TaxID=1182444 RepID=A0AAU9D754_9BACT|nr:hypothetical protein FUAX_42750 [Fulvitalea axinellae]
MKAFCKNIHATPSVEEIKHLTQQGQLVLEFPREEMNSEIAPKLISELKEQLPVNYMVFKSGVWEHTITITIMPTVSDTTVKRQIEFIKKGIKDYLAISKMLLNDSQTVALKDWELVEEHGDHNRYKNTKTGQILETCSYEMTSFENIDPYFWGVFVKTSTDHTELKELINSEFHDSQRILDYIEKEDELKEQVMMYMK